MAAQDEEKDSDKKENELSKFFIEHTDVKKGSKVKFPKLVQPLLLGFAYSIREANEAKIHLSSIQKDRKISIIELIENNGYKHLKVQDPYRDCNKLYMAISGRPTNQALQADLEDFGIDDKFKKYYNERQEDDKKNNNNNDGDDGLICIGDWWLDDQHSLKPTSKILLCINENIQKEDCQWITMILKCRDLDGQTFIISSIIKKVASIKYTKPGTIIVPVIQPLKYMVKTDEKEGFVYIG